MEQLSSLDYLKLNKLHKILYKLKSFFCGIPAWFVAFFKGLWAKIKNFGLKVKDNIVDIGLTFKNGSWKTRVSFFIMGFGSIMYGQWLRGVVFFLFEAVFIVYMALTGGYWLSKFGTLGTQQPTTEIDPKYDVPVTVLGDNSFKILLYGLITILFMIAFVYTWRLNVKQCRICESIIASGKKVKSGKQDLQSLVDDQFHKTLLALPVTGIVVFTVIPIIFMVLVAFTNYDASHPGNGYSNLFTWIGFENFNAILDFGGGNKFTFGEILGWTLIWAFFATFTNYFLGMFVAMMINKKGIYIKKFWRTILVMTIAIPQFISLLYVSNLFSVNGIINATLINWGWISSPIMFWEDSTLARTLVILINIWIGIPYLMLISTGILMNIPQDLYEQARIDGANVWQQYTRITLPYMLFVTGPYLLTSFTSNINNFNVIYLLTNGQVKANPDLLFQGQAASDVDLLITWLFNITTGATNNYKMASVIGIFIFLVVAIISLIVYRLLPSNRREGDFS